MFLMAESCRAASRRGRLAFYWSLAHDRLCERAPVEDEALHKAIPEAVPERDLIAVIGQISHRNCLSSLQAMRHCKGGALAALRLEPRVSAVRVVFAFLWEASPDSSFFSSMRGPKRDRVGTSSWLAHRAATRAAL